MAPPRFWSRLALPYLAEEETDRLYVACWMVYLGFTPEAMAACVEARELASGRRMRSGFRDFARKAARFDWDRARWMLDGIQPSPAGKALKDFMDAVPTTGLPRLARADLNEYLDEVVARHRAECSGRTARTDRSVLAGGTEIAKTANTLLPNLAVRQVSELTCHRLATTHASIKRLEQQGWLSSSPYRKARTGGGTPLLIRAPVSVSLLTGTSIYVPGSGPVGLIHRCSPYETLRPGHPAFHRNALCPSGHELLDLLVRRGPVSKNEWMEGIDLAPSTFYKTFRKLTGDSGLHEPLVVYDDGTWSLVPDIEHALDRIAAQYGTDKLAESKSARHKRDQSSYPRVLLRHLPDRYQPHDAVSVVDVDTGEVHSYDNLVSRTGVPRKPVGNTGADPVSVPTQPTAEPSAVTARRPVCVVCGWPTDALEPVSGLPWHRSCVAPSWLAKHLSARHGVAVPDHLVIRNQPPVDPYVIDPEPLEVPLCQVA